MPFEYRNQPLKAAYIVYSALSIPFVRVPYWIAIESVPSRRPRRSWPLSRSVIMRAMKAFVEIFWSIGGFDSLNVDPEKNAKSADKLGFVWVEPVSEDLIQGEIAEMAKTNGVVPARVSGYWYGKKGTDGKHGQPAAKGERVLYQFHGGGYVMDTGAPGGSSAPVVTGILEHNAGKIDRAFCPDYRLASGPPFTSRNPFPSPLIDAISGYYYLIHTLGFAPENIILSGDSAGGHLAHSFIRYLATEKIPSLPMPRALISLSPTVDWACTHDELPKNSSIRNDRSDFTNPIIQSQYTYRALLGSLSPDEHRGNAWVSPASLKIENPTGLYGGFPPTFMLVGGAEHSVDPMYTLRDRLVKDNGADCVQFVDYPDAPHDFLALTWVEPERTEALKELKVWLDNVI